VASKTYSLTHNPQSDRGRLFLLKTVCVRGERFKLDTEIFTLGAADHVARIYDTKVLLPDNQIPVHTYIP
jgi:hypothetical protein